MIDLQKMRDEQKKLAKEVVTADSFKTVKLIAGVDQAYSGKKIISAVVVCDYKTLEVVEKKYVIVDEKMPYIPGFLSYREAPAIVEAFHKLKNKPDVLLCDCNGILHPLRIGMASHVGLLLSIPTIGVAKNLLCGRVEHGKVYIENDLLGIELITKEHAKPIYISPGHLISIGTSAKIVKKTMKMPHKIPEPLYLAHRYADELRKKQSL